MHLNLLRCETPNQPVVLNVQGSAKTISKLAHPNAPLGYFLCFLNLGMDGFTNATQDSVIER